MGSPVLVSHPPDPVVGRLKFQLLAKPWVLLPHVRVIRKGARPFFAGAPGVPDLQELELILGKLAHARNAVRVVKQYAARPVPIDLLACHFVPFDERATNQVFRISVVHERAPKQIVSRGNF